MQGQDWGLLGIIIYKHPVITVIPFYDDHQINNRVIKRIRL